MKIAFLCKGSRGDVEPIVALLLAFRKKYCTTQVLLVCQRTAVNGLETGLDAEKEWLQIKYFTSTTESSSSRQDILNTETQYLVTVCTNEHITGIVFNLFTLEGYLIAKHLKLPCIAVSPFIISRPPPRTFKLSFQREHPFLYQQLTKPSNDGTLLSYVDIDHWMWRLFLDDIFEACDKAGILSFPLPYPPLETMTSFTGTEPGWLHPKPTKLLYGVSPTLISREQFWPQSVGLYGFWKLPREWSGGLHDRNLEYFIDQHLDGLVFVGFGSMEMYIENIDWKYVLQTLDNVLQSHKLNAIVQCTENGPINTAYVSSDNNGVVYTSLYLLTHNVPHSHIFTKCRAVIHHGGAGTLSTALLAGIPQIICPVMFDQSQWGHIIQWKGLGVMIDCKLSNITHKDLYTAIQTTMDTGLRENVKLFKDILENETSIDTAIDVIWSELVDCMSKTLLDDVHN